MARGTWREGETDFLSSESLDGSIWQPSDTLLAIRVCDNHISKRVLKSRAKFAKCQGLREIRKMQIGAVVVYGRYR